MSTVTVSLTIDNRYELYPDEETYEIVTVPAPPADHTGDEFAEWKDEHIRPLCGVGHPDGESWYDVTITDSSDPALIGLTFDWGY